MFIAAILLLAIVYIVIREWQYLQKFWKLRSIFENTILK